MPDTPQPFEASSPVRVEDVQITMLLPDGSSFYVGRPGYKHENPFIDATRGVFERARFEVNRRRFNALVARHQSFK